MTAPALIVGYDPTTKLADIPWHELPPPLQVTCERFLKDWWDDIDIDQTIEASGLSDMTLADMLALQKREEENQAHRRYRLITFMRIESEDHESLTYEQALSEKEQQELMCPENSHRIEEIPLP